MTKINLEMRWPLISAIDSTRFWILAAQRERGTRRAEYVGRSLGASHAAEMIALFMGLLS